jgi:hypothetical protein
VTRLSQSGPALFAYASTDVAAKIFFARGTDPVKSGKINERKYDKELRYGKVLLREFPEQIRPFIQEREQEKEKNCCSDSDDLPGTANSVITYDPLIVFGSHRYSFLVQ